MSNLQSYSYPGFGEFVRDNLSYASAIRVGDRIMCAGQGGWEPNPAGGIDIDKIFKEDLMEEIDQAFKNVDMNLKHAGGKGWSQVYRIVTYSTDIPSQTERIVYNIKKWMPDHYAVWTELGVKQLGAEKMHIEIEVEAYDEEGAAEARKEKPTKGKTVSP